MKVLVTGGAGYIGSVLSQILTSENLYLIIIDDLRNGNKKAIPNGSIFYNANYGDTELLNRIFSEYEITLVFHLAASANVPDSVKNPVEYYYNNLVNSINLLNIMTKYNVNKIVYSSTAAAYGEPAYTPIDEGHDLNPINPYGWSKLMVEQIIRDFSNAYDLKYHIFRYFCAAGATRFNGESRKHETHLIPTVIDSILDINKGLNIFGNDYTTDDGTGVRDYIHVLDIVKAHILSIEAIDIYPNEIFNLGSEQGSSVFEVITTAEKMFNKKISYRISQRRQGDPAILIASSQKALDYLHWEPRYTLEDILLSTYNWRKNPLY